MPLNASEFPISHHSNNDWSWKRLRRADYGEWSTYSEWHWLNEVGLDCRCWWRRPRPWQRQRVPRHWNANMCARKSESHKADFNLMRFSFRMSINQVDLFTRHWLFNQSRFTQQDQQTRKKNQLNIALNYRLCMCEYWNQFNKQISVLPCHSNRRIFCRRIELKAPSYDKTHRNDIICSSIQGMYRYVQCHNKKNRTRAHRNSRLSLCQWFSKITFNKLWLIKSNPAIIWGWECSL